METPLSASGRGCVRCRLIGHTPSFVTQGRIMTWSCRHCGLLIGEKTYETGDAARRYAAAFNHRDTDDLGQRAPLIGLLPLRLWRRIRRRR